MNSITEDQLFIDSLPKEFQTIATKYGARLFELTMEMGYLRTILIGLEGETKGDEFYKEGINRIETALTALSEYFIVRHGWVLNGYKACQKDILEIGIKTDWKIDTRFPTTH